MAFRFQDDVLKEWFSQGLRDDIKERALLIPDWRKCSTLAQRQELAVLAAEQVVDLSAHRAAIQKFSQSMSKSYSSPPVVHIPRDPNAMDVDVNSASFRRNPFPPLPAGLSFEAYKLFCHKRSLCHCCHRRYDHTHKAPGGRSIPCPFPPVSTTRDIEIFMANNQTLPSASVSVINSLPRTYPHVYHHQQAPSSVPTFRDQGISSSFQQTGFYNPPPHMMMQALPMAPTAHDFQFAPAQHFPSLPQDTSPAAPHQQVQNPVQQVQNPVQHVSALFTEYQNINQPTYYDNGRDELLDERPMFDPTNDGIDDDAGVSSVPTSAVNFKNSSSFDTCLILSVNLILNGKRFEAKALVDSGASGSFLDKQFVAKHDFPLHLRPFPLNCITFDGSAGKDGLVTHFWKGGLEIADTEDELFKSEISLDVTVLGGYDVILGMDWLRLHHGWVGGSGPSLRLESPSLFGSSKELIGPLIFATSSGRF